MKQSNMRLDCIGIAFSDTTVIPINSADLCFPFGAATPYSSQLNSFVIFYFSHVKLHPYGRYTDGRQQCGARSVLRKCHLS